jgi:hypothetical protein
MGIRTLQQQQQQPIGDSVPADAANNAIQATPMQSDAIRSKPSHSNPLQRNAIKHP